MPTPGSKPSTSTAANEGNTPSHPAFADASLLKILYFGDIVGTPGRMAFTQLAPKLRAQYGAQVVIANAENMANGTGLTPEGFRKLTTPGNSASGTAGSGSQGGADLPLADGVTLGDHVFKKQQIRSVLDSAPNICRPANLPAAASGRGYMRLASRIQSQPGPPVYVIPVLGRIFMNHLPANDPFACVDHIIKHIPEPNAVVLVEIHAEATSEKIAMGWHCNGRVAAVVGSHTHVPTADTRILPTPAPGSGHGSNAGGAASGTAYQSDLGMCGPMTSVLGRQVDRVLTQMTTGMHAPFDVATEDPAVQGVAIAIDPKTQRAVAIERFEARPDPALPPFNGPSND